MATETSFVASCKGHGIDDDPRMTRPRQQRVAACPPEGSNNRAQHMKLLDIQSSPRGESSASIAVTNSFIEACRSNGSSIIVDTMTVWHEQLPEFDCEAIGAKYKAVKHAPTIDIEPKYGRAFNP
jgi:hypothetical protein